MTNKFIEASTLLLTAMKRKPYTSLHNYNVLSLKRSEKSKFMPNGFVFPGGAVDSSDSDLGWVELFHKLGVSDCKLQDLSKNISNLPPIFDSTPNRLSKLISLRIAAIRETFEETGILLARSTDDIPGDSTFAQSYSSDNLNEWRERVHNNSPVFLEMCHTLKCIPDIWGLKIWSNWLTPNDYKKRFDTSFFTACLSEQPPAIEDNSEIEQILWRTPGQLLKASSSKKIWIPPPQCYEISRIFPFYMLEDLAVFSRDREAQGCEIFTNVRMYTKEGMFVAFAGDDLQKETDREKYKDYTFLELRTMCKHIHRIEILLPDGHSCIVTSNVSPRHGHLLPVQIEVNGISGETNRECL